MVNTLLTLKELQRIPKSSWGIKDKEIEIERKGADLFSIKLNPVNVLNGLKSYFKDMTITSVYHVDSKKIVTTWTIW